MRTLEATLRRFGRRLRQLRADRGWSQEDLAGAADMDRSYIADIERGVRNPSLATIARLANALGCKVADLFTDWR